MGRRCYGPVKLFCPHPPGTPVDITFFGGCPGLFITLFLPYPSLIIHFYLFIFECSALFHFIFECPALFYHTHTFPLTPGLPRGGIGAEQFDRRIIEDITCSVLIVFFKAIQCCLLVYVPKLKCILTVCI